MSTRSNIVLKLRQDDVKKRHRSSCGISVNPNGNHYLTIYCHHDGYPEGVGRALVAKKMTYEQALAYILEGDRSTVDLSYFGWRGEKCPPTPMDAPDMECEQEYIYLLEEIEIGEPVTVTCICNSTGKICPI